MATSKPASTPADRAAKAAAAAEAMEHKIGQLKNLHPQVLQTAGLRNGMSNEQIVRALEASGHEFE